MLIWNISLRCKKITLGAHTITVCSSGLWQSHTAAVIKAHIKLTAQMLRIPQVSTVSAEQIPALIYGRYTHRQLY